MRGRDNSHKILSDTMAVRVPIRRLKIRRNVNTKMGIHYVYDQSHSIIWSNVLGVYSLFRLG